MANNDVTNILLRISMRKFFILLLLIFCFAFQLNAQWTEVNELFGVQVNCLAVSDNNIFAGISDKGVYLSTNNGTSWTEVSTGLTHPRINCLAVSEGKIFAGTWYGIFLSTNNGTSWTESGLTNSTKPNPLLLLVS